MISLFAFLLVLGIVVDDAIIVGESIHTAQSKGVPGDEAALWGVREVFKPVLFAVISTMVFFAPMMFMPGEWAHAAKGIPCRRIAGFDLFIGGMSLDSARTPVETGPREARYDTAVEAVRGLAAWLC